MKSDIMVKLVIKIEPKPQSRPRFSSRGGMVREDRAMKSWRRACSLLIANQCRGHDPLEGVLRAKVGFYIQPPQYISKPKKNQQGLIDETMPVGKKPDLDNYIKSVLDSANGIIYQDDGQIAELVAKKVYSFNPRIELEIERMDTNNG